MSGPGSARKRGGRTTTPKKWRGPDGHSMFRSGIPYPTLRDGVLYKPGMAVAWPGWTGSVSWVAWGCKHGCGGSVADETKAGEGTCKPHHEPYRWFAVVDWGMRIHPNMPPSKLRLDSLDAAVSS